MISGSVLSGEARVSLKIQRTEHTGVEISAVIDTGYTGSLTLPPDVIATLGLPWMWKDSGTLADGTTCIFDVYEAIVIWDGKKRTVFVDSGNSAPLIGMALLKGYELNMQVRSRGKVRLKKLK